MSTKSQRWRGCGEKGTLLHCRWECKLVQPVWKTGWRFLSKLNLELPCDPQSYSWAFIGTKLSFKKIYAPLCFSFKKIHAPLCFSFKKIRAPQC